MPQAFSLLEQGEAHMIVGALSSFALQRRLDGAPIGLAAPKEGIFPVPSGIAVVKGGPNQDLAFAYVNELLGAEVQNRRSRRRPSPCPPTWTVPKPPGMPTDVARSTQIDWAFVADQPRRLGEALGSRDGDLSDRMGGAAAARPFPSVTDMTPAFLAVRRAAKTFGGTVLDGVDLAVAPRRVRLPARPLRLRQDHAAAHRRRADAADSGSSSSTARTSPPAAAHRDVGVVFQSYALFPHLTVAENVAFGLEARGAPKEEIRSTVARFLDLVHMSHLSDRSVRALSGGQQQRVAVARALAVKPKLMLLDEPFSALDRKLRETMQIELKRLLREVGTTAIFVTHDQDEALMMSDRIAVMNRGRIEQLDDAGTIYKKPATPFALGFVGLSTRIPGTVVDYDRGGRGHGGHGRRPRPRTWSLRDGQPRSRSAVRPELMALRRGRRPRTRIRARLTDVVFQGSRVQAHFDSAGRHADPDRERRRPCPPAPLPARHSGAVLARRRHAALSHAGRAA
jgi:putative spermidine/putrescine transport system ATP-binding protein